MNGWLGMVKPGYRNTHKEVMITLTPLLLFFCQGEVPMAVLQSGARVESSIVPQVGDREVQTAYGVYDATLDPVVEIAEGQDDLRLLDPLAALDQEQWFQRISERGLLASLAEAKPRTAAAREAWLEALTVWGGKLDTLPSKTDRDKRTDLLWKQLLKADDAEQALLTGALLREIPQSRELPKRRIGLVDLRRGLEHKDAEVRRAAALIALHQSTYDLERPLLTASLEDKQPAVRQAAASALQTLQPERSLGLWTLALWRERNDATRQHAAAHLGAFGSSDHSVAKALIHALASSGNSGAPRSYVFFGKQIAYISDYDVEVASGAVIADPIVSVLTEGTTLQIRVISTQLAGRISSSLKQLTGQDFGTNREAWMRWYEKTYPQD